MTLAEQLNLLKEEAVHSNKENIRTKKLAVGVWKIITSQLSEIKKDIRPLFERTDKGIYAKIVYSPSRSTIAFIDGYNNYVDLFGNQTIRILEKVDPTRKRTMRVFEDIKLELEKHGFKVEIK